MGSLDSHQEICFILLWLSRSSLLAKGIECYVWRYNIQYNFGNQVFLKVISDDHGLVIFVPFVTGNVESSESTDVTVAVKLQLRCCHDSLASYK